MGLKETSLHALFSDSSLSDGPHYHCHPQEKYAWKEKLHGAMNSSVSLRMFLCTGKIIQS